MPELPEVETVARQLDRRMRGARLRDITVLDRKLSTDVLEATGGRIVRIYRSGKQVVFELGFGRAAPRFLVVHLRMTGRLVWTDQKGSYDSEGMMTNDGFDASTKSLRAKLRFDRGELFFFDTRRFGTLTHHSNVSDFAPRGVEPLSADFTTEQLHAMLRRAKQGVKAFFMRQDRIVGVGNIYASEILFRAGVSPKRSCHTLKRAEIEKLYAALRKVLSDAIAHSGTTFSDYRDSHGKSGSYQFRLAVYDRQDETCRKCRQAKIRRIVQQQRSTYFCPTCQR
ncbi:MAG: bifunctional DNA-formamidopyrimidine glycosylase/DNA-(apurinic or apyrimidinic site) lyase [Deltaproteobacteria bacterium]|nr:bifunctional DNA-formamidopyrimidine glycosylase/DNA-(apurinic or apyrimidinic site) lyase [Deltaproteobacteria bacterium]